MRTNRTAHVAFSILFLLLSSAITTVAQADSPGELSSVLIDISDLPGFQKGNSDSSKRNATELVSFLMSNSAPEVWMRETSIELHPSIDALVIKQTQQVQQRLFQLVRRMKLFSEKYDGPSWRQLLADAEQRQKRILVLVSSVVSPESERFFGIWDADKSGVYTDAYELHCVPPDGADQMSRALRKSLGIEQPGLYAFSQRGRILDFFGPGLSSDELTQFLNRYRPELPAADAVFDAAIQMAKQSRKLVFVLLSNAKGCGSCDRLKAVLALHQSTFDKDYVTAIIDTRMKGSDALGVRLGKTDDWVPWYAIVSTDGKMRINSESKTGNIGFPFDDADRAHFQQMIESTRERISKEDLQRIMKTLRGES